MNFNGNNGHTDGVTTLIDELLAEQGRLTAVERFSNHHDRHGHSTKEKFYRALMPARAPGAGEQYAFQVDLDACSGCKACVAGCHSLNGLDDNETWREVGMLIGTTDENHTLPAVHQTITSACHHCVEPGCMNGCPVKAYDKDPETGIVRHLDDQCMGCQYCVMKCPYEVPKYSEKLGIVRKCDMCVNRLAEGEAPACVQSCPNGAITIQIVKKSAVVEGYRNNMPAAAEPAKRFEIPANTFLAGSPNPQITFPTTRYLSKHALQNLFAADHAAPRLDHPHWPLVVMLVFTQAAVGIFLASLFAPTQALLLPAAFILLNIGLAAAPLHLGRPMKAWRAFLGWRTSWLSRELIAFNVFAPVAATSAVLVSLPFLARVFPKPAALLQSLLPHFSSPETFQLLLTLGATLVGLGCVAVSAMVYVDTKRACWSPRLTFGAFFGTTLLLGSTFTATQLAVMGELNAARGFVAVALAIRTALFLWRQWESHLALSQPASPIHLNARAVRELLPWSLPAQSALFGIATLFGLFAFANMGHIIVIWSGLATVATLAAEILARYLFFRAGAGKRMPGGIAA